MKLSEVYRKHEYKIFLVFSVLLGFTPLAWFKGHLLVGEEHSAVNYAAWGRVVGDAWINVINYGEINLRLPFKLQGLFFIFLEFLGLKPYGSLIIWHVFLWVLTSLFFYLFVRTVFKGKASGVVLFMATVFYVYSPYFLNTSLLLTPPRLVFILLPLIGLFLYNHFVNKKARYKSLFNIAVAFFIFSPVFVNIPAGSIPVLLVILYLFFVYILEKDTKELLFQLGFFLGVFLLLNLWWLLPYGLSVLQNASSVRGATQNFDALLKTNSFDVLSLFGKWSLRERVGSYYYVPFHQEFDQFPLLLLRYAPIFLVLGSLFVLKNNIKKKTALFKFSVFIFFIYLMFIFLSKGANGFGGQIYEFFFEHFPYFWLYREPYAKFMPIVAFSNAYLIIVAFLFEHEFKNFIVYFILLIFIVIGYPIWTGEKIWRINDDWIRSYEIIVPDYIIDMKEEWVPKEGYYLLYPSTPQVTDRHMWPSGFSGSILVDFFNAKELNTTSGVTANPEVAQIQEILYRDFFSNPDAFVKEASSFGISGIFLQGDYNGVSSSELEIIKQLYQDFHVNSFGPLDIYEFSQSQVLVEALSLDSFVNIDSEFSSSMYLELKDQLFRNIFLVPDSALPIEQLDVISDTLNRELSLDELWQSDSVNPQRFYKQIYDYNPTEDLLFKVQNLRTAGELSLLKKDFVSRKDLLLEQVRIPKDIGNTEFIFDKSSFLRLEGDYYLVFETLNADFLGNEVMTLTQDIRNLNINSDYSDELQKVSFPIEYTRLSNSIIEVLPQTDSSFVLKFNESYNRNWLLVQGASYRSSFNLEGYANGWYLQNPKEGPFYLVFWPTLFYKISIVFSTLLIIFVFIFLYFHRRKDV